MRRGGCSPRRLGAAPPWRWLFPGAASARARPRARMRVARESLRRMRATCSRVCVEALRRVLGSRGVLPGSLELLGVAGGRGRWPRGRGAP